MSQLLMRRPDVHRFISISAPAGMYDHSFLSPCPASGLFICGTNDEITPHTDLENLLKNTARQKDVKLHYSKVAGADHFYTEQQEELSKTLCQYIISNTEK